MEKESGKKVTTHRCDYKYVISPVFFMPANYDIYNWRIIFLWKKSGVNALFRRARLNQIPD